MMDRVLSWSFALALAGFLLFMSFQKVFGFDPNPVFGLIEARSGIGFFEPGVRYLVAVLELAAAILVVWPRTRIRGAQLGLLVALGAIAFHLSPWLGWQVPKAAALSEALGRGLTAAQIDALHLGTDQGAMFLLAATIALLAAASIFVEWSQAQAKASGPATPPPRASFA